MAAVVSVLLGLASALFAFTVALPALHSAGAAISVGLVAGLGVGLAASRQKFLRLSESGVPRFLKGGALVLSVLAIALLVRAAIFMADPSKVSCSTHPSSLWEVEHSCLTAYHIAAEAVDVGNVYDSALYSVPDSGGGPRIAKRLGPFRIDVFEYPPQFLLLPRALRLVAPDFLDLRLLWFGVNAAILLAGLVVVSSYMGGTAGTRALLLSPLMWVALPTTINTLQKGNVQILIIATSVIAMVLIAKNHRVFGGALLAFAIVSKLWPGMLIVYLAARRDWRAVGWVSTFAVAFSAVTLAAFGWGAYATFLNHAPGLLSGEAFPAFRNPMAMANNLSVPNVMFKLKLFGLDGATFGVAKVLGWLYTAVAVGLTVWAARKSWRRVDEPLVWLAILILATHRSPFLPLSYGTLPALWLLTLVAAIREPTPRSLATAALGWIALNLVWPQDWPADPRMIALMSFVPLIVSVALAVRVIAKPLNHEVTGVVGLPAG